MRLSGAFGALITAFLTVSAVADQPEKKLVFGTEANIVRLSISVFSIGDRQLTPEDFTILDADQRQPITYLSKELLPMDMTLLLDISNSMSQKDAKTGKVSLREGILASAEYLVQALKPTDRLGITTFADRQTVLQEFTGDKKLLTEAIHRITPGGTATVLTRAIYTTLYDLRRLGPDTDGPRRRVILVITDAVDNGSGISDDRLRNAARSAEISVYTLIWNKNLEHPLDQGKEQKEGIWLLKEIGQESGGAFLQSATTKGLTALARQISGDLSGEYTIGWLPSPPTGKPWHTIQVGVRGVPPERLRYRNGYLAY